MPWGDNQQDTTYVSHMLGERPYYILKIDTKDPPELGDFVASLTGIGNQFEKFISERHPEFSGSACFYVQKVRSGSFVVEILPMLQPIIERMDQILIVKEFASFWQVSLKAYLDGFGVSSAPKSDLKDWLGAVKIIAKDSKGHQRLSIATYEDGRRQIRSAFKFDTLEARIAEQRLTQQIDDLSAVSAKPHRQVVMHYRRMDRETAAVGKGTGERVIIDQISPRPMPVVYQSELAEVRIRELLTQHALPWTLNFVVDVLVVEKGGKPSAYAITNYSDHFEDEPDE